MQNTQKQFKRLDQNDYIIRRKKCIILATYPFCVKFWNNRSLWTFLIDWLSKIRKIIQKIFHIFRTRRNRNRERGLVYENEKVYVENSYPVRIVERKHNSESKETFTGGWLTFQNEQNEQKIRDNAKKSVTLSYYFDK